MASFDPRLKHYLMQELINFVYEGTEERRHKAIASIARRNALLDHTGVAMDCFTYKGQLQNYTGIKTISLPGSIRRVTLHPNLRAEMDAITKEQQVITDTERPFVVSLFTRAMNLTKSLEDYKVMFPDCMMQELNNYPDWTTPRELTDEQVQEFIENNEKALDFLRHRKVLDLLLI